MQNLRLVTDVFELNKEYTKEELFHSLHHFCDCDFNGDNGEEYYRLSNKVSDLEYYIEEGLKEKKTLKELISMIIDANYKHDSYYNCYDVNFIERDKMLIVSVATVSD